MPNHEIQFDCQIREDGGVFEVVPWVDGVALTELIDRFETNAQMQPAGGAYGGFIPRFFRFGSMEDHFHGRFPNAVESKTPVLGCACGDWGCWPLMVRITVTDDLVIWDCFEQPHRPTRDYTGFGPFRFGRHQYDGALQDLTATINSDGR